MLLGEPHLSDSVRSPLASPRTSPSFTMPSAKRQAVDHARFSTSPLIGAAAAAPPFDVESLLKSLDYIAKVSLQRCECKQGALAYNKSGLRQSGQMYVEGPLMLTETAA